MTDEERYERTLQGNPQYWSKLTDEFTAEVVSSANKEIVSGTIYASACENPKCSCSTGIHEGLTFGSGELDDWGYWEEPCDVCARAYEKNYPDAGKCWPFSKIKKND